MKKYNKKLLESVEMLNLIYCDSNTKKIYASKSIYEFPSDIYLKEQELSNLIGLLLMSQNLNIFNALIGSYPTLTGRQDDGCINNNGTNYFTYEIDEFEKILINIGKYSSSFLLIQYNGNNCNLKLGIFSNGKYEFIDISNRAQVIAGYINKTFISTTGFLNM